MTATLPDRPVVETLAAPRRARRRRYAVVVGVLVVLVVGVDLASLSVGDFMVSVPDVLRVLTGHGTPLTDLVVRQFRLPRVVLSALAGACLALAGALFQSLLHNALASPDILGVTGGATVASVLATVTFGFGALAASGFAVLGALVVAALIYALAWDGTLTGPRFVLVGIGVAFMVSAVLGWVLTRAEIQEAQVALVSLVGGVGDASWATNRIAAIGLVALSCLAAASGSSLRALQLGDDTARALGVPVQRRRLALLALAVGFAAVGVASAGPLAFVAFLSAPIARRMLRSGDVALLPAALVGALLVSAADFAGQHLVPGGTHLPAGVLTGAIGAPYLLWLLTWTVRVPKGAV